jgi:hypothetical protein
MPLSIFLLVASYVEIVWHEAVGPKDPAKARFQANDLYKVSAAKPLIQR